MAINGKNSTVKLTNLSQELNLNLKNVNLESKFGLKIDNFKSNIICTKWAHKTHQNSHLNLESKLEISALIQIE